MGNIVKAQFFQIIRDKVVRWMFIATLIVQVMLIFLPILLQEDMADNTGEFFAMQVGGSMVFPIFFVVVVTGQICGIDFLDKTHNYELMGGHSRWEVFMGRVIPSIVVGAGGAFCLMMLPYGIHLGLYGWGTKVVLGSVVLRWILMLLVFVRMVCEFAFLTFLVKNPYVVMGMGYVLFILSMSMTEMLDTYNVFLGVTNLSLLGMVSKWATYGLGNDMNYIFDATLPVQVVWGTIVASFVFGIGALYLGYVFFKNDDMN